MTESDTSDMAEAKAPRCMARCIKKDVESGHAGCPPDNLTLQCINVATSRIDVSYGLPSTRPTIGRNMFTPLVTDFLSTVDEEGMAYLCDYHMEQLKLKMAGWDLTKIAKAITGAVVAASAVGAYSYYKSDDSNYAPGPTPNVESDEPKTGFSASGFPDTESKTKTKSKTGSSWFSWFSASGKRQAKEQSKMLMENSDIADALGNVSVTLPNKGSARWQQFFTPSPPEPERRVLPDANLRGVERLDAVCEKPPRRLNFMPNMRRIGRGVAELPQKALQTMRETGDAILRIIVGNDFYQYTLGTLPPKAVYIAKDPPAAPKNTQVIDELPKLWQRVHDKLTADMRANGIGYTESFNDWFAGIPSITGTPSLRGSKVNMIASNSTAEAYEPDISESISTVTCQDGTLAETMEECDARARAVVLYDADEAERNKIIDKIADVLFQVIIEILKLPFASE